jgi:hypothetical protein
MTLGGPNLSTRAAFICPSSNAHLTLDISIELTDSSFSNVLVAPLAAQLLQVALPDLPIDRVYTGILNSNQHLVVRD